MDQALEAPIEPGVGVPLLLVIQFSVKISLMLMLVFEPFLWCLGANKLTYSAARLPLPLRLDFGLCWGS